MMRGSGLSRRYVTGVAGPDEPNFPRLHRRAMILEMSTRDAGALCRTPADNLREIIRVARDLVRDAEALLTMESGAKESATAAGAGS